MKKITKISCCLEVLLGFMLLLAPSIWASELKTYANDAENNRVRTPGQQAPNLTPIKESQNKGAETVNLNHIVDSENVTNITSHIQYTGSVIVDGAGQQKDPRSLPLDVRAKLVYDQRISSGSTDSPQAIRFYEQAVAVIKAGQGAINSELEPDKKLILSRIKQQPDGSNEFQFASVGSMLRQKDYELLKNPGDPLSYPALFNKNDVQVGDQWKLDSDQAASLLAINRITSNSIQMMLKGVEEGSAKIYIFGGAKGEVAGAVTEMQVKGIAQLDLSTQQVTSLRMSVDEERRAGQVAPGFEGKIKLDLRLQSTTGNVMLSKEQVAEKSQGKRISFEFLLDRTDSAYQLIHDPRWYLIASEKQAAVLRLLDQGELIAQCNIAQLASRPADRPLKMSQFQEEIKRITSESHARIIDSEIWTTDTGYQSYKVACEGMESGIPFLWVYYHVAAEDGKRANLVFTLEKEAQEYLGTSDRRLVNGFSFKPPRPETAASPAAAASTTR